jgi:hypothetical protein
MPIKQSDMSVGYANNVESFTDIGSEQTPINNVAITANTDTALTINRQNSTTLGTITGLEKVKVKITFTCNLNVYAGPTSASLSLNYGVTSGVVGGTLVTFSYTATGGRTTTFEMDLQVGKYTLRSVVPTGAYAMNLTVKYTHEKSSIVY